MYALVVAAMFLAACQGHSGRQAATGDEVKVVATTTMLGDMVTTLAGDNPAATTIMRAGADPHLYRPTPADARAVTASDLVVLSGLHLEGWADDLVQNVGGERLVATASHGLDVIRMEGFAGGVDPHFWFDVGLWRGAVVTVADALVAVAADPDAAQRVRERQAEYDARLSTLDSWVRQALQTIPLRSRILVTSHDAFNYFGRAYELEVVGIQGISTESEASQRDVANVVDLIRRTGAPAVFTETSVNPTLVERVAAETGVTVAGPLYSDSIGPPNSAAGTYIGMVTENVRMIVEALGGAPPPLPSET